MKQKLLFFDWNKIIAVARSNQDIIKTIEIKYHHLILKSSKDKFFHLHNKDYSGDSFILNPDRFIEEHKSSVDDKAYYLYLASFRNYADYKLRGERGLNIDVLDESLNLVKLNKLLRIENNYIYFIFEDN